jgi:hypothetical protein
MQGVLASRAGDGLGDCPYSGNLFGDPRSHEAALDAQGWQNGWQYARRCWVEARHNPSTPDNASAST